MFYYYTLFLGLICDAFIKLKELSFSVKEKIVFNSIGFIVVRESTSICFGCAHIVDDIEKFLIVTDVKCSTKCLSGKCL